MRYELIPDSEGAGRFRGGLGLRRDYRPEGEVVFSVLADRARFAPQGLAGGLAARPARYVRNPDSDKPVEFPSKMSVQLAPGEVFSVQMPGGGGYGDPLDRAADKVLEDVLSGKISPDRALNVYGVVVDVATASVDLARTDAQRARRREVRS